MTATSSCAAARMAARPGAPPACWCAARTTARARCTTATRSSMQRMASCTSCSARATRAPSTWSHMTTAPTSASRWKSPKLSSAFARNTTGACWPSACPTASVCAAAVCSSRSGSPSQRRRPIAPTVAASSIATTRAAAGSAARWCRTWCPASTNVARWNWMTGACCSTCAMAPACSGASSASARTAAANGPRPGSTPPWSSPPVRAHCFATAAQRRAAAAYSSATRTMWQARTARAPATCAHAKI